MRHLPGPRIPGPGTVLGIPRTVARFYPFDGKSSWMMLMKMAW